MRMFRLPQVPMLELLCGGGDVTPTSIETRLQYETTSAGESNQVVCEILGPNGEEIIDLSPQVAIEPDVRVQRGGEG